MLTKSILVGFLKHKNSEVTVMKNNKKKMLQQKLMGITLIIISILVVLATRPHSDCGGCLFTIGLGLILLTSKDVVIY